MGNYTIPCYPLKFPTFLHILKREKPMKTPFEKLLVLSLAILIPYFLFVIITTPSFDTRSRATDDTATPSATLAPSETPTASPTAPSTPTPTPTNSPPLCLGISVNPGAGSKPMTVSFACAGYDANNDVTGVEFGLGAGNKTVIDKNIGQYGSFTTTYTYPNAGTYDVTCRVKDASGVFSTYPDTCKYTVIVTDNALTPTPIRTPVPTRTVPIVPSPTKDAPVIYYGSIETPTPTAPSSLLTATPTPIPSFVLPKTEVIRDIWANEKIRQAVIMVTVSIITIFIAIGLHSYFDNN